jgi:hypothetical protein
MTSNIEGRKTRTRISSFDETGELKLVVAVSEDKVVEIGEPERELDKIGASTSSAESAAPVMYNNNNIKDTRPKASVRKWKNGARCI